MTFLTGHIAGYGATAGESHSRAQEYLDSVINEYFLKFPWRLKVSENPDALPASEQLSLAATLSTMEIEQKQRKVVAMRKVRSPHHFILSQYHFFRLGD